MPAKQWGVSSGERPKFIPVVSGSELKKFVHEKQIFT
jgi:hypothetical protein